MIIFLPIGIRRINWLPTSGRVWVSSPSWSGCHARSTRAFHGRTAKTDEDALCLPKKTSFVILVGVLEMTIFPGPLTEKLHFFVVFSFFVVKTREPKGRKERD